MLRAHLQYPLTWHLPRPKWQARVTDVSLVALESPRFPITLRLLSLGTKLILTLHSRGADKTY